MNSVNTNNPCDRQFVPIAIGSPALLGKGVSRTRAGIPRSNTSRYASLRYAPDSYRDEVTYRLRVIIVLIFTLAFASGATAQTDAKQTLRGVYNKLQKAKDYSVQANIKVDMPFLRILPIDATIYYKQKDKFKVVSKSIAIVPRQGFDQASKMLADTNSFTAVAQGNEMIGNIQTSILNIIPLSDTSDLILGKLWVDPKQSLILKSQLTTKSNGTILTEYTYGTQSEFGLPDKMIFSVDVKKFKVPKGVSADLNNSTDEKKKKENENKKGRIFITLTSYQVNKGIPDAKFKK